MNSIHYISPAIQRTILKESVVDQQRLDRRDPVVQTPLISRRELTRRLSRHAIRSTPRALCHFLIDFGIYALTLAGVLFLPTFWLKGLSSIVAGLALGRLFSFAHNAAHENLAKEPWLNRAMAFLAFSPFLYNYRLWVFEHHCWHHPHLNDSRADAYKPFSKTEFDALPMWRQYLERFYRAPNVIGWGAYYLIERHFRTKIYPPRYVWRQYRLSAWMNTVWLAVYTMAFFAFLLTSSSYSTDLSPLSAVVFGFVVPLLVFEVADGFTLYAQHTDPRIPWFKDTNIDRNGVGRSELLTVHLQVPAIYRWWSHNTHAHPVHHLMPGIPFYTVYAAQLEFDQLLGNAAVVRRLGIEWWLDTMRRCKLYDWDRQQWLDFDGKPTTPTASTDTELH
jgi:acyl-lipid omega-6 desaturase (Delta-12 desaturase)